jgi:hypothetical protein
MKLSGEWSLNRSSSLGSKTRNVVADDGRQKLTSSIPFAEAWRENQLLSVMATYIRMLLWRKYSVPHRSGFAYFGAKRKSRLAGNKQARTEEACVFEDCGI